MIPPLLSRKPSISTGAFSPNTTTSGRRREETRELPREVVEAARDALDGDSKDEGKTEEARPASGSLSLEDVVRDALQPVLKSWLDENLPKLIEKQLREEVGRALGKMKRNAGG